MAKKQINATAKLFIDFKDAKSDAAKFVADIKQKLNDIENAADKFTVFKDVVSYIGDIDRALGTLKANNKDVFNQMFGNLDSGLRKQLEGIFGISGGQLGQIDALREKLNTLTPKSSIKEVRGFAKELNALFTSVGRDAPFDNIDMEFSGRTRPEDIDRLSGAFSNFATVWDDVVRKIGKGFGVGSNGATAGGLPKEVQSEVDKLQTQITQLNKLKKSVNTTLKNKHNFDDENDLQLTTAATAENVKNLIALYKKLDEESVNLAEGTSKYNANLAERARIGLQLNAIAESGQVDMPESARFVYDDKFLDVLDEFEANIKQIRQGIDDEISKIQLKIEETIASANTQSNTTGGFGGMAQDVDLVGKKVLDATEYINTMKLALKNMFDIMSQPSTIEFTALIDGHKIDAWAAGVGEVSLKAKAESYLANLGNPTGVSVHSHQGERANLNYNDISSAMRQHYSGLTDLTAIIGKEDILTLDLTKVKAEDAYKALKKLKELSKDSVTKSLSDKQINKVFTDLNAEYSDVVQRWNPEQFGNLAQKIDDVQQKSTQAIEPLERLKNLITYIAGDKKIDFSKYKDLFESFSADEASNIFNHIMKTEGIKEDGQILQVSKVLPGSLESVAKNIQEQKDSFLELRRAAKLTYSDIQKQVNEYLSTGNNADFFKKYYHPQEIGEIYGSFNDVTDGLLDANTLTNRIASDFYIDPENFVKSTTQIEEPINKAKTALKEFFALTDEIQHKSFPFGDAEGNVEIGRYTERLETAQSALIQFAQAGEYTKEELQEMESAFKSAQQRLSDYTTYYDGYGNGYGSGEYSYTYEDEYLNAKGENERLRHDLELTEKQYQDAKEESERLRAVINAIDEQSAFAKSLNETAEAAKRAGSGAQEAGPTDKFTQSLSSTKSAFTEYRNSLQDVDYLNDEVKQSLNDLAIRLGTISDTDGLKDWKDDFSALKDEISVAKEVFEKVELDKVQKLRGQLNSEFKNLDFMTTTSNPTSEQQEILDLRKKLLTQLEEYKLGIKDGKEVELDAINQTMAALRQKINVYRETNDLTSGGKQKFGATAVLNATAKYNSLSQQASGGEFANSLVVQQALKQYEAAYNNLIAKRKELAQVEGSLTDTQKAEFKALTDECNKAAKSLSKIITDSQKLQFVNPEPYFLGEDFDNSIEARKTALTDFVQQMYGVTVSAEDFRDNWNEVVFAVDNGDGTFTNMTATFNAARTQIGALAGDVKKTTGVFESFFNELKGKFKSIGAYMIATVSIHDIIRVVKQGVQYVKEIDLALTELKKVTDETEQSYDNFLNTASQTASKIGSTVADFTNATADFARLGYNMEQAAELAKAASVYKNVGDGINDIATASESIISTMKAFGIEADSAMGIVDRFNEIGNNFAISSTGIGEAMQRSASALYAAGNTIDESIALITGANSVIQDPAQVGTALKTLSLRLRGAKVELEEAGLETDNMAESTSQLQAKLNALTHGKVDIMLDADTFKSTTQIIREMSQAWEDMTDVERAAALELMGGKRQANILASLITNFETVEEVIKTSVSSSGSAMSENEKYLSSIQGKIELFTNAIQTMWMNTLNDDVIKFFVDVGAAAVQLVDKLGLIPTLLGSFVGFKLTSNALKKYFDDTSSSAHTTYGKFKELINAEYEEAQASKKNAAANQEEANAHNQAAASEEREEQSTRELASADAAETKESLKNASANRVEADAHNATSSAEAGEKTTSAGGSVSTGVVSGEVGEEVAEEFVEQGLKKGAQGVVKEGAEELSEEITEEIAEQGFKQVGTKLAKEGLEEVGEEVVEAGAKTMLGGFAGSGIKKIFGKLATKLAGSGVKKALGGVLGSVLGGIGGAIISSIAFDLLGKAWEEITEKIVTAKEAREIADNAVSQYSTDKKSLAEQKKTIDELSKSYEALSKGVDVKTNDNISLTAESYDEYLTICNQIADMYPHLVTSFDAQGNAILSLRGNVDALSQSYKDAASAARQSILDSGDEIFKTFKNTVFDDKNTNYHSSGLTDQIEVAQKLIEAINTDDKDQMQSAFDYVYNNKRNALVEMTKSAGLELGDFRSVITGNVDVESFKGTAKTLLSFVKSTTSQINSETSKVKSLLDAYLGEDLDYASYSDKTRFYIDQIIANLDAEFIKGFNGTDELYNHIKTNIVDAFQDVSITDALSELSNLQLDFNKGNISYVKYQERLTEQISKIQNKFDSDTLSQIKLAIGIDEESLQIAEKHIATIVNGFDENGNVIEDVQNKIDALSVEDLQIAGQLEVPEGTIYTWDELIAKIHEAKIAATKDFDLSDYKTAINSVTESISTYQEAIQKLDKGSFTLGDFMELIEEMPELAKGVDISSKSFSGLRSNLQQAIKTSTKSFIRDLKELKYRLIETGKSTESIDQLIDAVENMPDDALDSFIDKYGTLADTINEARAAQEKLSESMNEEETGYETRGEAMEYMKGKLEEGKIGSESNVWNVAEQYGFTYDSSKTINENADALAKYIAVRERWFKEADDGDDRTDDGYAFEGIENFMQDVEEAVKKSEELQQILSWTYDEDTGTLNFDFDNENLDTIIQSLSQTDQLAGLTKEEFIDMIKWVGQYFNINWSDNDDILNYLDGVATSAKDAKTKVEEYGAAMQKYLGGDSTIDLTQRPMVSKEKMQQAGWTEFDGDYATTYSSTYTSEDGQKSIVVTPILPDNTILSPQALDDYAKKLLAGEEIDPKINIKLGEFNGADSQKQADEYAQTLSKAQAQYDQLRDSLNINATIDSSGVEGLQEIKELQETITTNSEGVTIIDQEAFVQVLKDAGYTQDQIDLIIDKIKKLNSNSLNDDLFKIDETLTKQGVSGLKEIESLQSAIKESSSGWTVVDTDLFTSVLQGAGYTKTQIDELIKKIQEYNSVVLTSGNTDPLGLDATNMNIDTLKASLDTLGVKFSEQYGKLGDGLKDIKIDVPDLVTMLNEKGWSEEAIRNYCAKLSETNLEGFQIKVDQEEIDAAIEKANEVPAEKPINVEITGTALTDAQNINSELDKMQDKTVDVTINETTVKKTEEADANGTTWWNPLTWFANGTAHASGTAFAGGNWGAPSTETALVGELGPELLVRGNRWTTIGENGAEFTQVKRGDIIFNHKQTESLLKNGYVTSRGRAYASGTAYAKGGSTFAKYTFSGDGGYTKYDVNDNVVDKFGNAADKLSDAADKVSDSSDDFKEAVDWIEIRIEEINEKISLKQAQLENAVGAKAQNKIIDSMIADNQVLYDNLLAGANEYYAHAKTLLGKIPAQFRDAAKNGSIAITEFAGKTSEEAYNAIQEYREWTQKGADATQQAEEVITEIRSLAVQAFDNIAAQYDGENSITEAKNAKLEAAMNRAEERGRPISEAYYLEMAVNTGDLMTQKKDERKDLQSKLNKQVRNDEIEVGGKDYNKMVAQILELDAEIIDLETDIESYQNAINDLHWDNFDTQIERLQNISDETQELIDLFSEKDLFDEVGEWTDEGIASIGLYGQQMENAKLQAAKYADAMATLTEEYENGLYSESEYADKMAELQKGHYGAIKSYNDAEDAIIDMNKARVEAIKEGIDKEIEAYDKLIEKKKEELDSEKDLHDFRKRSQETTKNIADLERQLAALAGDNSMAAQAKRARLEADLAEARTEQEEMYYERSVSNQQEALDKSRENFTAEKEAEKEELETQLEDTKAVVAEAFKSLEENAAGVHTTLTTLAGEYGLQLSDAIVNPWKDGATTMGTYWKTFTDTGSDAITGLTTQLDTFYKSLDVAEKRANAVIEAQNKKNQKTMEEKNPKKPAQTGNGNGNGNGGGGKTNNPPKAGATVTVKKSATHFGPQSGSKKMASFVPGGTYTVYETMGSGNNTQVLIGKNGAYTGWIKLTDIQGYAKGTVGVDKDQLAWIDELGEELVLQADGNGKLKYLTKGSSVIPHDITENLMSWGALDPSNMLEQNRPSIGVSPEVHNTEINLDCSVGTMIHIEHCDQGTLPDVEKMVNKAFDKYMSNVNNSIKKFVR